MSLPNPYQGQLEDWANDFEEKNGRFPTMDETTSYLEGDVSGYQNDQAQEWEDNINDMYEASLENMAERY